MQSASDEYMTEPKPQAECEMHIFVFLFGFPRVIMTLALA